MISVMTSDLQAEIASLIEFARSEVCRAVNSSMVMLYWQIGTAIKNEILKDERGEYGEQAVKQLGSELSLAYGRGFSARNLFRMLKFSRQFPDKTIVPTLSALSWSHFVELMTLDDPLKCQFYAELCRVERWSIRTLREKINGMLYERTAISHRPEIVIQHDLAALKTKNKISQDLVFKDPYILDFLSLPESYSESDLESAIKAAASMWRNI